MSESKIIPNSYQTPNFYADQLMEYLTAEEWKVLSYAMRRIFGFNTRKATISISMFTKGFTTREGVHYSGTGMGINAVLRAIAGLVEAGIMQKIADNDRELNYGATYSLQLDSDKIKIAWLIERKEKRLLSNKARTEKARFVGQNGGGDVGQNGGGDVGQNVKTHETHETQMAQAPEKTSQPLPLDWQILTGQPIELQSDEQKWKASVDIACMNICKHGADLEPLARAFIEARQILPGKRDCKGWALALREMKTQKVTPDIVTLAVQELTGKQMTIADPWGIKKTAISKANPIQPMNSEPSVVNGVFYG